MQKNRVNNLTDRISIIEMIPGSTASGAPTKVETVVKSCRAHHKEVSVAEDDKDGKVRALYTDLWEINYDKQFTKGRANHMLIKDDEGFVYNIVSVVPIQGKFRLQINTVRRE